jgi:hypothetical protein
MSNVSDALSGGGSDATGVTDTSGGSFGDTPNLTDSDFAGLSDSDIMGASGGPNEFGQFSNLANALSSGTPVGSSSVGAQTASMTPPGTAAATGGDPAGSSGGTQSNTAPGSTPTSQNQQQQSSGGGQHDPDHAPPSAVAELKTLLKGLSGQPTGPTGPTPTGGQAAPFALPTLAAGQTGAQSPGGTALRQLVGAQPAAASLEPAAPGMGAGPAGTEPGGARDIRTELPIGSPSDDFDPATGIWSPRTAAGTLSSQTPLPPPRPKDLGQTGAAAPTQTADAGGGSRDITVKKPGSSGDQTADLPTVVPPGSAAHPLPTHKPGASPAPAGPATSSILNDISGVSTGSPTALADLAQAAKVIAPLLPMIAGMFGGGGRRFGRFHGGRFTHGVGRGGFNGFRGGMNAMRYHGGQHPMARGAWPYHHPQFGWHMHGRPPGGGWLPLHPNDAQALVGGQGQDGQDPNQDPNAPDPNRPPKETGASVGAPTSVPTSGAIPGVGAKDVDDYTRSVATKWGIDPDVASKILAQESSYGQARRPGDNGTSFGPFQLHFAPDGRAMGDDFKRDTGLDPRDPSTWKDQIDYAMKRAAMGGWAPWTTTMNKLGLNQWSGITTNRRFAGKLGKDPTPGVRSADAMPVPAQLPPSSQPMVAGP